MKPTAPQTSVQISPKSNQSEQIHQNEKFNLNKNTNFEQNSFYTSCIKSLNVLCDRFLI